ncbi:hypothetical protein A3C59_01890 [Candidatus Daviesbacteria bacterium RIFCSPHIGHO2_02_FULL_36_13]|uniref:Uncharacterized protein n=1 Tax=Candidatus Daviesbacteria bacterium RIFCSPHIGHO2_02_FULL_36_13 TaxID=1797768 RepID=A0A1F5JSQ9_9BACT|nr:MAG: hypothetical protein A3C59_01890 [Candidatus Daviesbacteria bacterium RIFCSPHIGHO2_02_FULL_36_13]OGE44622.1 MAG: hypothetical protein A3A45_02850 [Candidatus Daviesbacteria bacterium RIFCSPLOWO2_01_FULL_36_8]
MFKNITLFSILCLTYYLLVFKGISISSESNEIFQLKDRFGTTIWHTSDKGGDEAIYCYYPAEFKNYVFKKVGHLDDCENWYGVAVLYEGKYATEINKYL